MVDEQDWLKLQIGSSKKPVPADAFIGIFQNTIAALKAMDRGLSSHGGETIQWEVIEAGSNSPIFTKIRGREESGVFQGTQSRKIAASFVLGLSCLSHEAACPSGFQSDSLKCVERIVSEANLHHLNPIYSTATQEVRVTRRVAVNANRARHTLEMGKSHLVEYGTIEGRLRELSESHSHDKLGLLNRLTGEITPCYLRNEKLEQEALKGWRHRVAVTGDITVNRETGLPTKVMVDEIRILRDRSQLPQIEDLCGIDITGGMEPAEYVRSLRDVE